MPLTLLIILFDVSLKKSLLNVFEYSILLLLASISMLLLISSYDFISMYLAIEMQSLCLYVLAASKRHSEFSTEAGLKYFLLGAFSSGVLLFGCALVYGFTGFHKVAKTTFMRRCSSKHLAQYYTNRNKADLPAKEHK